jgi:hypothetical protein
MKRHVGLGLTLAMCAAAEAAEPAAASTVSAAPASAAAPAPAPEAKLVPRKPLDLSVGDVRSYMMPNEYRAALGAPDADKNTVVVEAKRELLPMKSDQPVPGGIIAPFWAIANPLQAWRILVPDLKRPEEGPREPHDKVPPPIFRWGP